MNDEISKEISRLKIEQIESENELIKFQKDFSKQILHGMGEEIKNYKTISYKRKKPFKVRVNEFINKIIYIFSNDNT